MNCQQPQSVEGPKKNGHQIECGFFNLRKLAVYSSCSVRWLRDRLVDQMHPLPHYRIGGKLLIQRNEFDRWIQTYRVVRPIDDLSQIVESVLAEVRPSRVA